MTTSTTEVIGAGAPDVDEHGLEPAPFRVLGENIVVELVQREDTVTFAGGIEFEIVQEKQTRPPDVVVVGIGPLAVEHFERVESVVVELGTTLIVRKNEGLRLELGDDGRELYVYRPAAVLGIVA